MSKWRVVFDGGGAEVGPIELAKRAVREGFGAIEVADGLGLSEEAVGEIRGLGVEIACLSGVGSLSENLLGGLVRGASEFGIGHVLVPRSGGEDGYGRAYDELYRLLYAIGPEADELGVRLLVCGPQREFLLSPLEVQELIDAVSSPNVGCCVSFEQCVGHGLGVGDWLEILGGRVFACRVGSASDMAGEALAVWSGIGGEPFCITTGGSLVS